MSSSDASDLVDSDESGVAEPPRKKRVLVRRSSTSTRCGGAKKPRLERSGEGEAAAGLGRTKGETCVSLRVCVPGKYMYDASRLTCSGLHTLSDVDRLLYGRHIVSTAVCT